MLHYKLQIGCILVVVLIMAMYIRTRRLRKNVKRVKLFEWLLFSTLLYFCLDMASVYAVNHLETVPDVINRVIHLTFLYMLDRCMLNVFLYITSMLELPVTTKKWKVIIFLPHYIGVAILIAGIPSLDFVQNKVSNYSMGLSVYICYGLVLYYFALGYFLWRKYKYNISRKTRREFLLWVPFFLELVVLQAFMPYALMTSLAITLMIIGAYCSVENAANRAIVQYHEEVIYAFAGVIEGRDGSTGEHVKRTAAYVRIIVDALKERGYFTECMSMEYIDNLLKAAPMHDFGKIAVTDIILNKPGKLTAEEFEVMKLHTVRGADMIQGTMAGLEEPEYVDMACQVARYHHERWDGRGYPEGLKGNEIPLSARVMAIADVFDAVSQKRCYRDAMSLDESFAIIEEGAGTQFDPVIAAVFLQMRDKVEEVFYEFQEAV